METLDGKELKNTTRTKLVSLDMWQLWWAMWYI